MIRVLTGKSRKQFSKLITFALLATVLSVPSSALLATTSSAAITDTCSSTLAAQNGMKVTPSHGKAFYIDSGITPKLDAGYVGYIVTNTTNAAKNGYWLKISDFAGGVISLANIDDQYMQLDNLGTAGSGSESSTAYIMLKASAATSQAQSHVIRIFDKRPDLSGASELYSCKYSFSSVKETIKAASNKVSDGGSTANDYDVNTTAIDVSNTSPQLGENIVITVEGQTGQIGQGGLPDNDSIWLTPAAISSWPTRALKLVDVSVKFEGGNDWGTATDQRTFNDRLLITGTNGLANVDSSQYVASYTFRVIGNPGSGVKAVPVAQIASGTQMKHTDTSGAGATATINFATVSINYSLAKRATSTTNLETTTVGGQTYIKIPYEIKMTSTSATTTYIDEIVDIPVNVAIFDTGTARITDATRTTATISDPTYISSEASLNPRPMHFVGPFGISSAKPVILTYKLMVPAVSATYTNQAYAMVGDFKIGASASTIPQVSVTTTSGSTSVSSETSTVTSAVEAITTNATEVDTKTATLNATVDPNGNGGTAVFQYGTLSSLSSFTEVTATTPSSGTLTGSTPLSAAYTIPGTLTPNTTYYFRIRVGTVYGDILSFTTNGIASSPSVTTLAASAVAGTTATLNGTINPNFTPILGIVFLYLRDNTDVATNNATVEKFLQESDGTANGMMNITAGGGTSQSFSLDVTSLTNARTYYYIIRACTALSGSGACSTYVDGGLQSFTTGRANQTITFNAPADKTYGDSNFSISPTTSATGETVTVTSLTPSVCTLSGYTVTILSVGTCTIRATQPGTSSYNPAPSVDQSFYIGPKTLTITAEDKSKIYGQSTPSWTNTLTGFAGSDSATISTISRSFTGKSVAYPESSTAPTAVGTYSILLANATLSFSSGSASNYTVSYVEGTYTINDAVAQTITFNALSSVVYGAGTQSMTATASSGLTVTYTVSGPCTVSGAVVTITGIGSCVITAAQSGGTNSGTTYGPAESVQQTLVITAKPLTITATTSSASKTYGASNPTFGKTYSGLVYSDSITATTLTFTSSSPSFNSTSIPTTVGVYTITPSSPTFSPSGAGSNYTISYETTTYTINKADQAITFNQPTTPVTYGASSINLGATSSSGLAVSYAVSGQCSISGSTVTFTGTGSCVITASQSGNSNYNAALSVERTIVIDRKALTITASSHTVANGATAPTITPSYSGFAGSETETVLTGSISCSITGYNASTAGNYASNCSGFGSTNGNYSITYVAGVVTVASGTVASQSITFNPIAGVTYGVGPQSETATASSGLGVTFSVSGPCTLSGSTVTITGVGTCAITASQSGGTNGGTTYSAATPVTQNLVISPATLTISATVSSASVQYGGSAASKNYTLSGLQYSDSITATTLTFTSSSPSYNNTSIPTAAGVYTLTPSNPIFGTGSAGNYTINYVTTTYTITQKTLTITASSHAVTTGDAIPTITASYNAFAGSESVSDLTGTQTCSTTYTTSSSAGSYPTSCSGYTSSNYSISYVNGSVTATATSPTLYTITYTLNGGTGTTPTETDKAAGVSFNLAASSGFTKDGNTFSGWSCNSGSAQAASSSFTMTSGNLTCVAQWTVNAATTYTVTYSAGGGSGTVPTQSALAAGATFTTGSGSGLSRSGYTFAGWSCNSGATVGVGASVTMGSAAMSCAAQWTANSSGNSNSGVPASGSANSSKPTPAAVKKAATLVTLATTPVKATIVTSPTVPTPSTGVSGSSSGSSSTKPSTGGTTTTPGNSGSTPSTGGTTTTPGNSGSTPSTGGTTTTTPGNSGSTPSTGGTTTTPGNSGSTPSTGGTTERINVNNTQLSQTTTITSTAAKSVTFTGVGITQATVVNNEVAVQAKPGFSGKTTVKITVTTEEEVSTITADVLVIPLPVTNPVVKVVSDAKSRIQWIRSPNAVTYEVTQNGKILCTTAGTICTVAQAVSADAPVQIKALGRDQTESTVKQATYVAAPTTPVIPEIALVVNFDTAKYNLDAGDKALIRAFAADVEKYGYTKIDISGHTDSRGGIDNNVLSNNRAKAARAYLLSLLPNLKVTINGYADAINVASNATAEGMTANRRAEFRVVG